MAALGTDCISDPLYASTLSSWPAWFCTEHASLPLTMLSMDQSLAHIRVSCQACSARSCIGSRLCTNIEHAMHVQHLAWHCLMPGWASWCSMLLMLTLHLMLEQCAGSYEQWQDEQHWARQCQQRCVSSGAALC